MYSELCQPSKMESFEKNSQQKINIKPSTFVRYSNYVMRGFFRHLINCYYQDFWQLFSFHSFRALNFGALGLVIGHEVTHAFDNIGKYCNYIVLWLTFFCIFFSAFLNFVRDSGPVVFCKKAEACNFIEKETLAQLFACEFCDISKNTFLKEHLWWLLCFVNCKKRISG